MTEQLYRNPELQAEWDNDGAFHVARNVIHLRKFRRLSQAEVGRKMGTSQAAIARIEGSQENLTMSTLDRLANALKGRLQITIRPEEMQSPQTSAWWELVHPAVSPTTTGWTIKKVLTRQTAGNQQVLIGLERLLANTTTGLLLEDGAR